MNVHENNTMITSRIVIRVGHVEEGDVGPDLDNTLEQQVEDAAEVTHHAAERDPDEVGKDRERDGEQDRGPEAVEQSREYVAAGRVGPQVVLSLEIRRTGADHTAHLGILQRVVGDQGQDDEIPFSLFPELSLQIAVIDRDAGGRPLQAELRAEPHRPVSGEYQLTFVPDDQRLVVDQQLGKK
jgi:hypothetical protein